MNKVENIVHNQHIIPQSIQKHFSKDGLKVYGIREIKNKNIQKILDVNEYSIETTLYEKDIYEFPSEKLEEFGINYLEHKFAKMESDYQKLLMLFLGLINKQDSSIHFYEENFHKKYTNSFNELKDFIKKYLMPHFLIFYYRSYWNILIGNQNKDKEKQHEVVFERFENSLFDEQHLKNLAETIMDGYDMYLLISNHENFLLSDNFISTASIDFKGIYCGSPSVLNRSIGLKDIYILIPLSAKYYLLFTDEKQKSNKIRVDDIDVLKFNSIIYRNSYGHTIGRNKEMLEKIKNETKKYAYGVDYMNGGFMKHEVWVNENIDRIYYANPEEMENLLAEGFYGLPYKSKTIKKSYEIERNFNNGPSFEFKIVVKSRFYEIA